MLAKINYNKIFGIQIEERTLRMVEVEKNGRKVNISGFSERNLGEGIVTRGVVQKKKLLAQIIRRAMHDCIPNPIKRKKVICSIPENKSFIKTIKIPQLEEKEIQEAIKWETEDNIPLPIEKVYFDWKVTNRQKEDKKMEVLIVAAPKEIIDSRIETLEHADLITVGIEPDSFALAKCFGSEEEATEKPSLIVYFGSDKAVILVKHQGKIVFSSSLPFGTIGLKEEIKRKLEEGAEKKNEAGKKQKEISTSIELYGLDRRFKKGKVNFDIARLITKELLREIRSALNYFENQENGQPIEQIFLSGAGAAIKGMDTLFSLELSREIKEEQELSGYIISQGALTIPKKQIANFAIALGSALG